MPITAEELDKFEQEWLANRGRQRDQESIRRLEAGEFTVELVRAPDDPEVSEPAFQEELNRFAGALRDTGVSYAQTAIAMDSVEAQGFPLPEFIVAMKTLGPPVITAVAGYATAWVQARIGRKLRIRIGELEAEARTLAEIKALLHQASEYQDGRKAGGEREVPDNTNIKEKS